MIKVYENYVSLLKDTQKYRSLQLPLNSIYFSKNHFIDFSSNDYLSLSKNKNILKAGLLAGENYGVGATGSRLLSGNIPIFDELEQAICKGKGTEAALFFSSGYLANFSVLSALLDIKVLQKKPVVFFDKLNHASLYQGVFLTRPELIRYSHNDMEDLSKKMEYYAQKNHPTFIVTESVFGMDGDITPLAAIINLAKKYQAFLYIDEAHATGIFGKNGYGLSTNEDLTNVNHLIMGTFSKALGCAGAYIACSKVVKDYLVNKASGFIYSTASSPVVAGMALHSWNIVPLLNKEREYLQSLATSLREKLKNLGFNTGLSSSHIIPIILGGEDKALLAKERLLQKNILVSAIRPPTVPPNSARIRIALNTSHTLKDINKLIEGLQEL